MVKLEPYFLTVLVSGDLKGVIEKTETTINKARKLVGWEATGHAGGEAKELGWYPRRKDAVAAILEWHKNGCQV